MKKIPRKFFPLNLVQVRNFPVNQQCRFSCLKRSSSESSSWNKFWWTSSKYIHLNSDKQVVDPVEINVDEGYLFEDIEQCWDLF